MTGPVTSNQNRRAVLFDLDDTLTATLSVKWDHHRQVARDNYGIEIDDATLHEHWGKPFDVLISHLYRNSALLEEMRAANRATMHLFPKPVIPGAVEAVTRLLDAGIVVGVITSTMTEFAVADLPRLGFPLERLLCVQGADQTVHHKPDPRVFDGVLAQLGELGIDDITYVGDSWFDSEAAVGAGLKFIGVATGLWSAEHFGDELVLDSVAELPEALGL